MNKLKNKILFFYSAITLLTFVYPARAVEIFSRDSEHRGVVEFAPYLIYPENRIGNGIYLEKKLLGSHPQRVIINIVNVNGTDNHIYLYRGFKGVLGLDIVKNNTGEDVRFWQIDPEFYQYSNRTSGTRRVFRIFKDRIIPLLPNLRTGSGVTTSKTHAVFYHISNSKNVTSVNQNGQETTNRIYTFRLHVIKRDLEGLVSLYNIPIKDANYLLKLDWENKHSVSYKLSNSKKYTIDLRKHAPSLF
ncbi:MAG: hypothetical protein CL935_03355 [Deltaproteobacteria bacterium]|nr:hypothetical protein [Deltaproteobacteria bacterium]